MTLSLHHRGANRLIYVALHEVLQKYQSVVLGMCTLKYQNKIRFDNNNCENKLEQFLPHSVHQTIKNELSLLYNVLV